MTIPDPRTWHLHWPNPVPPSAVPGDHVLLPVEDYERALAASRALMVARERIAALEAASVPEARTRAARDAEMLVALEEVRVAAGRIMAVLEGIGDHAR